MKTERTPGLSRRGPRNSLESVASSNLGCCWACNRPLCVQTTAQQVAFVFWEFVLHADMGCRTRWNPLCHPILAGVVAKGHVTRSLSCRQGLWNSLESVASSNLGCCRACKRSQDSLESTALSPCLETPSSSRKHGPWSSFEFFVFWGVAQLQGGFWRQWSPFGKVLHFRAIVMPTLHFWSVLGARGFWWLYLTI